MAKPTSAQRAAANAAASAALEVLENERAVDPDAGDELIEEVISGLKQLEGAEQARWRVTCTAPLRSRGYVEELRTDELTPEVFRERYGPGEYRVAGFGADGKYIRGASSVIRVSELARPRASPEAPSAPGDSSGLVEKLLAEQDRRERERAASRKDLAIALGAPLITAAASIVGALISRPSIQPELIAALRPQSNLGELTGALANLDQLRGGKSDIMETVLKFAERLNELPAGSGKDEGWAGVIRDLVKEVGPAARDFVGEVKKAREAAQARGMPQAAARPVPPGAIRPAILPASSAGAPPGPSPSAVSTQPADTPSDSASPAPSLRSPEPSERNPMLDRVLPWLHRQAANLEDWAETDLDPAECAAMLFDSVPMQFRRFLTHEQLRELIARQDWWDVLVQFHPSIAPHKEWVVEGHAELIAVIDEEIAARNRAAGGAAPADPPTLKAAPDA